MVAILAIILLAVGYGDSDAFRCSIEDRILK